MKLPKTESKYRIKFIQEHHYNKQEQKQFDEAVIGLGLAYKRIYQNVRNGYRYIFMATIATNRLVSAFKKLSVSANTFVENSQNESDLLCFVKNINNLQITLKKTLTNK